MPILHAIVLGITQGLSEFLPISSSGHLQIVPWLFGWDDFADDSSLEQTFDVALHMGTLLGAVTYFRADLVRLARGGMAVLRVRRSSVSVATETGVAPTAPAAAGVDIDAVVAAGGGGVADDGRLAWLLLFSAVPAAITGAVLESSIADLGDTEWLIGVTLIVFGLVLLWADRLGGHRPEGEFRMRDALSMGAAQALALAPGVSRSGVTMTAGRWLRFDRNAAARLSFLMSMPIIAGAGLFKGAQVVADGGIPASFVPAFLWGMAASAVTGWLAVWGTIRLLRTRTFTPFVIYRVALGVVVIGVAISGAR